ncbi:uncharacterized protein PHACADRAFT_204535 [Phanerochaete carnosa HHB-10118-sp]|uniref:RRM domain-containing protein n=1 Tax=Phanerochaete carnosa (strain HHB-10118-sp) TaxID=650164 RepID=K5XEA3_PHACS|nr:uncharacterized protein PHACADRAFT_204535 [Phanerochaete carnosa HHB-10118-sp]EKM61367.1 hypothetical protein PHACADRAFT_204535 [Phanerochaete carnosa HHB-10118-sp]
MAASLSHPTTLAPLKSSDPSVTGRSTTAEDASQASSATTMPSDSLPIATPRFTFRPLRRSSSRIQRWVQDQQKRHSAGEPAESALDAVTVCDISEAASERDEWQAAPQVTVQHPSLDGEDAVMHDNGFEGDDQLRSDNAPRMQPVVDLSTSPPPPRKNRQGTVVFNTPEPLRNFARNLAQNRRISTSTSVTVREPSPNRSSIFQRSASHTRTPSFTTTLFSQRSRGDTTSEVSELSSSPSASTWRFRPAGIISHFHSGSDGMAEDLSHTRLSTSSSLSRSSETAQTRTSLESATTSQSGPSKRVRTPSMIFNPAPSLWSLPTDASHMDDPPESTKTIARERQISGSVRIPLPLRGSAGSSAPAILSSQKRRRKRKLVISGIQPGDQRRYEHVRMWCESFGELNQITRMPNGDLHVDFRRSEVADTVCRLHARVHINGVGSVGLSWFTGKKP